MKRARELFDMVVALLTVAVVAMLVMAGPVVMFLAGLLMPLVLPLLLAVVLVAGIWQILQNWLTQLHRR